jgi:UDPglucose 6-dehydrogenase
VKIVMIGTGYVGLVTGTCFAESGNEVTCVDIDEKKIQSLQDGEIPIYEPGLKEQVERNVKAQRLKFTTSYEQVVPSAQCVFIAVGTPQGDDGSANLNGIWAVADSLAPHLSEDVVVVIKSTVPVGTNRKLYEKLKDLTGREVTVASNPEFLKEGAAIQDFSKPDRVVVGVTDERASTVLHELYQPFLRTDHPFLSMGLESAEMTKYVANCMLATKISFINEMANLCERVGADINDVRRGIGHDQRIGFAFLFPGVGYGGSCFPKDVRALVSVAKEYQMETKILDSVDKVNQLQKEVLFDKISNYFEGDLKGKKIGIWGLSFKPGTDDVREAPSVVLINRLLYAGAVIQVHDPVAQENIREIFGDKLIYCEHHYDAIEGVDALAIVTEWNEFRNPDFEYMKHKMKSRVIFDGRNLYSPEKMNSLGFYYTGIGLKTENNFSS